MWNLVPDIKGGTQIEGVWEWVAEENIWSKGKWSWSKLHDEEFPNMYNLNDQVTEDEMAKACSTNGGEEECMYWWESQKELDY
jgi:hypothetical protein